MQHFKLCLSISICLTIMSACKGIPASAGMPDIGISTEELNTHIELSVPKGINEFKIGGNVGLAIKIIGTEQIWFPSDYGAKIFIYKENQWSEVENLMNYVDGYFVLPPSEDDPFKVRSTAIAPSLIDLRQPVTLRIFLVGKIYQYGQVTDEKTAAYTDVRLEPK